MSETEAPATQSLTAILAKVQVTSGDAIMLLNSLMEANADRSPTLVTALSDAIAGLAEPSTRPSEEPPVPPAEEPSVMEEGPTPL